MSEKFGFKITGTITGMKGECSFGHKVGDKFELSGTSAGGLCGYFYHTIFPFIVMMQCGGTWPQEEGLPEFDCPDRANALTIKLQREE